MNLLPLVMVGLAVVVLVLVLVLSHCLSSDFGTYYLVLDSSDLFCAL
jgi:hypothetical protein